MHKKPCFCPQNRRSLYHLKHLKQKHYFEFPALSVLVNSDVTSLIFRQLSDDFAERFTIIKDQKVQFLTSNNSARLCSITLKL